MLEGGNTHELDYLRSENERLQNKVLIIQAEYDLEKTKSEQLKDVKLVSFESYSKITK